MRGNVFWFGHMLNGQRVQATLGTSDYAEAVQRAMEIRANPFLHMADPFGDEVKACIAQKLRRNEYSKASHATKKYALEEFGEFIGKPAPSVTSADVARFYAHLQSRVAESTAQGYLITLRSFFKWLVDRNVIRSNPVDGVKLHRLDTKRRESFCSAELRDKLIAECNDDDLRFILFCGFHAGMRKNEIIEARPEWFALAGGSVSIKATTTFRPKDREARTVPLTAAFRTFLESYGMRAPYMLKPDLKHGKTLYRYNFRKAFATYMKRQKCEWVTPHVMRHTFASLLACAGVSIYKIAVWLGDGVVVVQKHYAKLLPKDDDIEKAFV
jgi:integrase